jgi:hypothetical protein
MTDLVSHPHVVLKLDTKRETCGGARTQDANEMKRKAKEAPEPRKAKKAKDDTEAKKAAEAKAREAVLNPAFVLDPPAFDVRRDKDLAGALAHYDQHGWVLLSDVAAPEDVKRLQGEFWDYMEELNGNISRDKPATWSNKEWPGILSVGGIQKYYGVGQSKMMWDARTLPNVHRFFAAFYDGTKALATSFDGLSAIRGAEHKVDSNRTWMHTDYNLNVHGAAYDPKKRSTHSIQGALALVDCVHPRTHGSFLCRDGGHKLVHDRWLADRAAKRATFFDGIRGKSDYCPMPMTDPLAYAPNPSDSKSAGGGDNSGRLIAIAAKAGQMLVWNSLLPHCNFPPVADSIVRGQLVRLTQFVTLHPLLQRNDQEKRQAWQDARLQAAAQGFTTSHDPNLAPKNNRLLYPRSKHSTPLQTPKSCFKTTLSSAERALVLGEAI